MSRKANRKRKSDYIIFNRFDAKAIIEGRKTTMRIPIACNTKTLTPIDGKLGVGVYDFKTNKVYQLNDYHVGQVLFFKNPIGPESYGIEITDVQVNHLQLMNEEDAIKEGFVDNDDENTPLMKFWQRWNDKTAREDIGVLNFEANPYVFVYTFKLMYSTNPV